MKTLVIFQDPVGVEMCKLLNYDLVEELRIDLGDILKFTASWDNRPSSWRVATIELGAIYRGIGEVNELWLELVPVLH